MHTGKGRVVELLLEEGCLYVQVACPENLIPSPGQYLLASDASDAPLPVPVFYTDSAPESGNMAPAQHFIASVSANVDWKPGDELALRGPLGRGFSVPISARKIGLVAFDDAPVRLRGLIQPALKRDASVVLLCASSMDHLPDEVEVQPLSALDDVLKWADYIAADVTRENLPQLKERLSSNRQLSGWREAQILVHTQMPCGGVAECGICALTTKSSWKLICKDGPVFDLGEI